MSASWRAYARFVSTATNLTFRQIALLGRVRAGEQVFTLDDPANAEARAAYQALVADLECLWRLGWIESLALHRARPSGELDQDGRIVPGAYVQAHAGRVPDRMQASTQDLDDAGAAWHAA